MCTFIISNGRKRKIKYIKKKISQKYIHLSEECKQIQIQIHLIKTHTHIKYKTMMSHKKKNDILRYVNIDICIIYIYRNTGKFFFFFSVHFAKVHTPCARYATATTTTTDT